MTPEEELPPINFKAAPAAQAASARAGLDFARMDALEGAPATAVAYPAYDAQVDRPRGVTVIAVLNFLAAGLIALGTLLILSAGDSDSTSGTALGVIVVQVIASIAVGIGLLRLQRWAYWTAVVLYALNGLAAVLGFFAAVNLVSIVQFSLAVVIVSYLTQPKIRGVFE